MAILLALLSNNLKLILSPQTNRLRCRRETYKAKTPYAVQLNEFGQFKNKVISHIGIELPLQKLHTYYELMHGL